MLRKILSKIVGSVLATLSLTHSLPERKLGLTHAEYLNPLIITKAKKQFDNLGRIFQQTYTVKEYLKKDPLSEP